MLPSLANKKMWDEVEDAIHGGWNVNSVLKVKQVVWRVSLILSHVTCDCFFPGQRPHGAAFCRWLGPGEDHRDAAAQRLPS